MYLKGRIYITKFVLRACTSAAGAVKNLRISFPPCYSVPSWKKSSFFSPSPTANQLHMCSRGVALGSGKSLTCMEGSLQHTKNG